MEEGRAKIVGVMAMAEEGRQHNHGVGAGGDYGEGKTTKSGLCGGKGRTTTETVLVMMERRRQRNRQSVVEEKGR